MRQAAAELVRINDKGEAHPIGTIASQRLRRREGAFRVLPAPDHVVFMRYTGEDGRRDEEDGAIVRLAGEITRPAELCDVLAMLGHTRWRGELAVCATDGDRSIFMENGNVVGAATTIERERLGQVMWKFGALDAEAHAQIMAQVERGARFGSAAVALGLVTREQVYDFVGKQIEAIVYGALALDDGTFFFLDGFDPDRLVSHHTFSASMLLMDGVTRLDEIKYFRQKVPSAAWVPALTEREGAPPARARAGARGRGRAAQRGRHRAPHRARRVRDDQGALHALHHGPCLGAAAAARGRHRGHGGGRQHGARRDPPPRGCSGQGHRLPQSAR
ncbi:MAG: DUF4388 domain-containing protein [Polyangiaceae bacterium]